MSKPTYGLAISTVVGAAICVYEAFQGGRELYESGVPQDSIEFALATVTVVAAMYALAELRHRLRILGQRPVFSKAANIGFWMTGAGAIVFQAYAVFENATLTSVVLSFACCIPIAVFGALKDPKEPGEGLDLFEYANEERRRLNAMAAVQLAYREHEAFLKEYPERARYERMPMAVKIRSGIY